MSALLAEPIEAPKTQEAKEARDLQYLTFALHAETFAMPIDQVREIIEYGHVTPVPMMPAHMRGVINLRGAVVPVIDLGFRFWDQASAPGRRTCIVIMELASSPASGGEAPVLGVIVDAVNAVMEIPRSTIEVPPSFGTRLRADFIQGMGKVKGRFVMILNVDKALSAEDLAVVHGRTSTPAPS